MQRLIQWFIAYRLIWVALGAFLLGGLGMILFFQFGGSPPSAGILYNPNNTTVAGETVITPACREKQQAGAAAEKPIQQQLQTISDTLNGFGVDLAFLDPVGQTTSLDDLANKVSPQYRQQVAALETQYGVLYADLTQLQQKYSC